MAERRGTAAEYVGSRTQREMSAGIPPADATIATAPAGCAEQLEWFAGYGRAAAKIIAAVGGTPGLGTRSTK
jgi:hypothetical protein